MSQTALLSDWLRLPDRFASRWASPLGLFGKRGILGEGILMIYRLGIVAFIAFIILGTSSVFYAHYIDVRDAEAVIMARNVVDCFAPEGVVNLGDFSEEDKLEVLSYCGFDESEVERFYVKVNIRKGDEKGVEFFQGDSGAMWVRKVFEEGKGAVGIEKYEPGYLKRKYDVIVEDGGRSYGKIEVEVLVNAE